VGQRILIIEDSWSHSDIPLSVGLLWTNNQPDAETSTSQHTTLTSDKTSITPARFETTIPASDQPQTHALDRSATGIGKEDYRQESYWTAEQMYMLKGSILISCTIFKLFRKTNYLRCYLKLYLLWANSFDVVFLHANIYTLRHARVLSSRVFVSFIL
jgi:hypothetical protein